MKARKRPTPHKRRSVRRKSNLRKNVLERLEDRRVLAGPGDIAFTGFNADNPDAIAFVALTNIPAGTTIGLTDNEASGSGFNDFNEGELEWSHTSVLTAGTVVEIIDANTTPTANIGSVTGSGFSLSNGTEGVFAVEGPFGSPSDSYTFLAGIANNGVSGAGDLSGTGLNVGTTFVEFTGSEDGVAYSGARSGQATFGDYLSLIGNTSNWSTDTVGTNLVPFDKTSFTASTTGTTLAIDDVMQLEGDSGTTPFEFTVTRSGDTSGTTTVDYITVDGSATAGIDYAGDLGTLTFNAGETTQTITVNVAGETDIETDETFTVTLSNASGGVTILDDTGIGTIQDDDTPAPSGLYINELFINPAGSDTGNEYIELRGTPSTTLPSNVYLVVLEGDGSAGAIDQIFSLGGMSFGSNGSLVLLQAGSPYSPDANSSTVTATGSGWGTTFSSRENDIENGSTSFLLIQASTPPIANDDVDLDGDGTLDGSATAWTIFDSIGNLDGGSGDAGYGTINFSNDGDGQSAGTIIDLSALAGNDYTPDYLGRQGNSTGSGPNDWVAADVDGTAPAFSLLTGQTLPASLAGSPLDHIGSENIFSPPAPNFALNILHASDLEGGVSAIGDAPNFAAIVQALEEETDALGIPSLVLSAGDNYIPGPFFSAANDRATFRDSGLFNDIYNEFFGLTAPDNFDALREGNGRVDISIMNLIGFDASAVGNHEFDASSDAFNGAIAQETRDPAGPRGDRWVGAQFPYLSANLDFTTDTEVGSLFTPDILPTDAFGLGSPFQLAPAATFNAGGETIGIVGATTQLLQSISSPSGTTVIGPDANDMPALAGILQPVINDLRDGDNPTDPSDDVNKIILVSHLQQISLEEQLAGLLDGVDVIVAGGSDTLLAQPGDPLRAGDTADGVYPIITADANADPVAIVSTDGQYSYVGSLVVEFDADGKLIPASIDDTLSGAFGTEAGTVTSLWGADDPFADGTRGEQVMQLTDAVSGVVATKDANVVGRSGVHIEGERSQVRTEETNIGNLTADANLAVAQTFDSTVQVSLKNGGGIRAAIGEIDQNGNKIPNQFNPVSGRDAHEVSQLDLENALRFNNGLTLLTVTAQELKDILEHGVAASGGTNTPGQFPQVGGMSFSFDPLLPPIQFDTDETSPTFGDIIAPGQRVENVALIDELGNVTQEIVRDGVVLNPTQEIRMVTLDFLWGRFTDPGSPFGGDGYPLKGFAQDVVQLRNETAPAAQRDSFDFAPYGSEQDALAEYLNENFGTVPYYTSDTPAELDRRIVDLSRVAGDPIFNEVQTEELAGFGLISQTAVAAAEIAAFDPGSDRLFVTGADIQILDFSVPTAPSLVATIPVAATSVAVSGGIVAAAVPATTITDPGSVQFFDTSGTFLGQVGVGPLPDMLTFSDDGSRILVANEGQSAGSENEPDILPNPNGSVSIIEIQIVDLSLSPVTTFDFSDPSITEVALRDKAVRVDPNAPSAAADLEPEFISLNGNQAFITLQENNAVAVIDDITSFTGFTIDDVLGLGTKDHTLPFNKLDPSNRDVGIQIANYPLEGLYMPDAIASYESFGQTFFVTANEGDGRDVDETRGDDLVLDPTVFPFADDLQDDAVLGRIKASNVNGDTDLDGDIDEINIFGGRSLSIFDESGNSVFDSGDLIARLTALEVPSLFNANNGDPGEFDDRSDDKGAEPEGVTLGVIGGETYAFLGLERGPGGVVIFNVSDPLDVQLVDYVNPSTDAGDIGPEGLLFISAADSPTGEELLVVTNEESSTVSVLGFRPPTVTNPNVGAQVNRSSVNEIQIEFDQIVQFDGDPSEAFILTNTSLSQAVGGFAATVDNSSGVSVVTLNNFTGSSTTNSGSLADGNYDVTVLAGNGIRGVIGLDGNGDGTAGDDASFTDAFFRLYGDSNGDGVVDRADLVDFRGVFRSRQGDGRYDPSFDFDGDGDVDVLDYLALRRNAINNPL